MNDSFGLNKTSILFIVHIVTIFVSIYSALCEMSIYLYSVMLTAVLLSMLAIVVSGATTPRMALFYLKLANTKVYGEVRHKYEITRAADYILGALWVFHNMLLFNITFNTQHEFSMIYKLIWFLFFILSGLIDVVFGYITYKMELRMRV